MYYLICNYNPLIIIEIQILLIRQLIWVNELLKNIYCMHVELLSFSEFT